MSQSNNQDTNQSQQPSESKPRPKVDPSKTISYRNDGIDPNRRKS